MLSISFKESKSKNFKEVLKLSRKFNGFEESKFTLKISKQDVYLKWGDLNLIFHHTLKWKGTFLNYREVYISDYADMKRVFYEIFQLKM